ncbi:MAG: hypothetical protein PUD32_00700, partial [Bacteroidales bacterium]|nr:hypothetical protein [Bacteroidales bacterium]
GGVFNSRVSSRLFPWTNSKPWCLLTIYWLSGKRIATYHKVLPDSKNIISFIGAIMKTEKQERHSPALPRGQNRSGMANQKKYSG